jgi:hypothetical protein
MALGLIACILFIVVLFPTALFERLTGGPVCLFLRLVGKPCLFCGLGRSLVHSCKFNFKEAFFYNPAGLIVFFSFLFVAVNIVLALAIGKRVSIVASKREKIVIAATTIAVLLGAWMHKLIIGF